MLLIDGHWYELPDGTRVRASKAGRSPEWYLLSDDRDVPCYGVYTFGLRQFVYDRDLDDYRGIPCDLTLDDLRQPNRHDGASPETAPSRAVGISPIEPATSDALRRNAMLFFVWYDDSPQKLTDDKLHEAIAAYVQRFRTRPTLVLMNTAEQLERTDITVRSERTVQPNTFWLGHEDQGDLAQA